MSSRLYRFLTLAWICLAVYEVVRRSQYINLGNWHDSLFLVGAAIVQLALPGYFLWRNIDSWRNGHPILRREIKTASPVSYQVAIAIFGFLCFLCMLLLASAIADLMRWRIALAQTNNLSLFLTLVSQVALPGLVLIELAQARATPSDPRDVVRTQPTAISAH